MQRVLDEEALGKLRAAAQLLGAEDKSSDAAIVLHNTAE